MRNGTSTYSFSHPTNSFGRSHALSAAPDDEADGGLVLAPDILHRFGSMPPRQCCHSATHIRCAVCDSRMILSNSDRTTGACRLHSSRAHTPLVPPGRLQMTQLLLAWTLKNAPSVPFAALATTPVLPSPAPPPLVCVALQGALFVSTPKSCSAAFNKVSQSLCTPPWSFSMTPCRQKMRCKGMHNCRNASSLYHTKQKLDIDMETTTTWMILIFRIAPVNASALN